MINNCLQKVPIGAVYIYRVNFFAGFLVAMAVYYLLCWIKPVPETSSVWCEEGDQADRQFSVVYVDDTTASFEEERSTDDPADDVGDEQKRVGYSDKTQELISATQSREDPSVHEGRVKSRRWTRWARKRF